MKLKLLNVVLLSMLYLSSCNNSSSKQEIIQPFSIDVKLNDTTTLNSLYQANIYEGESVSSKWFEYNLLEDSVRIDNDINNISININTDLDLSYTLQECYVKNLDVEAYRVKDVDYKINNKIISFDLTKKKHDAEDAILHFYKLNFEIDDNNSGFFYFGVTYGKQVYSYSEFIKNNDFSLDSFIYSMKYGNYNWDFKFFNQDSYDYSIELINKLYFVETNNSTIDIYHTIKVDNKNVIEVNDLYEGNNYKILTKYVMDELILTFQKEEVDFGYVCPWFNEIKAKDIDKIVINSGCIGEHTQESTSRIYINKFYNFLKNTKLTYDQNQFIYAGGATVFTVYCGEKTYSFVESRYINNATPFSPYYIYEGNIPLPKKAYH